MELQDFILIPLSFLLFTVIGIVYLEVFCRDKSYRKFFLPALWLKLLASLAYGLVYKFYYQGGDTSNYFKDGTYISNKLLTDWNTGWEMLMAPANTYSLNTLEPFQQILYDGSETAFVVVKMVAILSIFTFNSFFATSLLFSAVSFTGLWAMYTVFVDLYPRLKTQFAIAVFLIPSVTFWGSGIMKDTVTIGCIGWFFYGFYHLLIKKDQLFFPAAVLLISAYLILQTKLYIIAAFVPAMFVWFYLHHYKKITEWPARAFLNFSLLIIVPFLSWYFLDNIQNIGNRLLKAFISEALGFHNWHTFLDQKFGGSGYNLGTIEFTPIGILKKVPASINVALFRPYIFEVKNVVMLFSSFESTLVLLFSLFVWLRVGIFKSIKYIFTNPLLTSLLVFILLFAFVVGFTSYNFGALVRYKIPCMPFFIAMLFILLEERRLAAFDRTHYIN